MANKDSHKCWNCKKPTQYLDLDFGGPMCAKCSWLCFYDGVIKPEGLRAKAKVLMVRLGIVKIKPEQVGLVHVK